MPMPQPIPESASQWDDHCLQDIITLFDGVFAETFNTRLVCGGDEPLYVPAGDDGDWHQVIFARGFYTSALHEISHWCIAGERRRLLEDYGYWYIPDGRDNEQQHAFERVEIAPQALELLFSDACGIRFNVSVDNLGEVEVDREGFAARVRERADRYLSDGLPLRAAALELTLRAFYQQGLSLDDAQKMGRDYLAAGEAMASREALRPA